MGETLKLETSKTRNLLPSAHQKAKHTRKRSCSTVMKKTPVAMNNAIPKQGRQKPPISSEKSREFSNGSRVSCGSIKIQTRPSQAGALESQNTGDCKAPDKIWDKWPKGTPKASPRAEPDEGKSSAAQFDFRKRSVRIKPHALPPRDEETSKCDWTLVVMLVMAAVLFTFSPVGFGLARYKKEQVTIGAKSVGPCETVASKQINSVPSIQVLEESEKR